MLAVSHRKDSPVFSSKQSLGRLLSYFTILLDVMYKDVFLGCVLDRVW